MNWANRASEMNTPINEGLHFHRHRFPRSLTVLPESPEVRILYANDNNNDVLLLKHGLSKAWPLHALSYVNRGDEVIDEVKRQMPDLIILDDNLSGCDALECLQLLKQDFNTKGIPVVVYSECSAANLVQVCYELGAVRYLFKYSDNRQTVTGLKFLFDLHYNGLLNRPPFNEFVIDATRLGKKCGSNMPQIFFPRT